MKADEHTSFKSAILQLSHFTTKPLGRMPNKTQLTETRLVSLHLSSNKRNKKNKKNQLKIN